MCNSMMKLAVAVLLLIIAAGSALAGNNSGQAFSTWPDTGQTKCYNEAVEIPCPTSGQPFHGQDAQYIGPNRSYTVLGGGTMVQDNVTGLTWEMKNSIDGIQNYANPHDADNTYTWCNTNPTTNNGYPGTCGLNNTEDFINQLNATNFGGHTDWRIPTIKELVTLVDSNREYPSIALIFASTTESSFYWSSTTCVGCTYSAWRVGFDVGSDGFCYRSNSYYVRAVRGGQTDAGNRFIDNYDGTVTDTVTCLQWQRATIDTDGVDGPDVYSWQQALAVAENLKLAGYNDWRLPDKNELRSLVDNSHSYPSIDPVFASTTTSSDYWSSTSLIGCPSLAWRIYFSEGGSQFSDKSSGHHVRTVRGEQCGGWAFLTTQQRPPEPEISSTISGTGRKAVVLAHGWNSNAEKWSVDMANKICSDINGTSIEPVSGYSNKLTQRCHTADWDVFVFDWRVFANTPAPWSAWANAVERGTSLGKKLAFKNYAHVHLLAHSAGSMLIDSAKNYLRMLPNKPFIHLTFFDAYDPFAQIKDGVLLSSYGEGAGWVDNYVDKRPVDTLFGSKDMDGTQLLLPAAYNVDVTKWDNRPTSANLYQAALDRHAWPNVFYAKETFTSSMADELGYQLSLEGTNGEPFPRTNRPRKKVCTLPKKSAGVALVCESIQTVPALERNPDKIHTIGDASVVLKQVAKSGTGVVVTYFNPLGFIAYWAFETGSPVWSKMDLDIKEPVNALTFDYEFLSANGAEGFVTIFVDDNVVGRIDERHVESAGVHASDRMYIGELSPGMHTIAIRVDPYTALQSSLRLTNLKLIQVDRGEEFPWELFLPAMSRKHVQ